MNLNKKIKKFTGDGIPAYNEKFNELIDAVNWLAGFRTINGKAIAESDQGPILDLSQVNASQGNNPWETDPEGNRAGWSKIKVFDPGGQQFYDLYAWTGGLLSSEVAPWILDLNKAQANWLSGPQGEVWGTGTYPTGGGAGNFQQIKFTWNLNTDNPRIGTGNPPNAPITPPASAPALYFMSPMPPSLIATPSSAPYFNCSAQLQSTDPGATITYAWKITYDGTVIYSISGSGSVTVNNSSLWIALDPAGWTYDPVGLVGYAHGSQRWIYEYQGAISSNTNPTILETFDYSLSIPGRLCNTLSWNVTLLTA